MTEMLGTCGSVPSEGVRRFRAKVAIVSAINDAFDLGRKRRKRGTRKRERDLKKPKVGFYCLCATDLSCAEWQILILPDTALAHTHTHAHTSQRYALTQEILAQKSFSIIIIIIIE